MIEAYSIFMDILSKVTSRRVYFCGLNDHLGLNTTPFYCFHFEIQVKQSASILNNNHLQDIV